MLPTIEWKHARVRLIDQTQLPRRLVYIDCGDVNTLWRAIKRLQVRGAPALGIAASLGVILGVKDVKDISFSVFMKKLDGVIKYLGSARPTAVNLFWAL
ncbi:MAG: S-methyl-5-thioribose-1-phosphate isomerase, partial [Candidatus Omnitrophica bacterium]|nr:S-methyl-5-thioribose-1-phosphate isomerase [Candidatus Omnitrophota bacterium]